MTAHRIMLGMLKNLAPGEGLLGLWASRFTLASGAPLADYVGRFLRLMLLSRLLSKAEFGTSIALTVVITTAALITDVGLDRFVLLKTGPLARSALAAAHVLQIARGLMMALGIFALAGPIADMFGVAQATNSFRACALVPLIHGLAHLGPKQAQQTYNFRQDAFATAMGSAVALVAAAPAAWLCRDHNAIIWSLAAGECASVLTTHFVADRRYEAAFDSSTLKEAIEYGLPLMANGAGLAFMAQADRFLVGAMLGVETLGVYAVILNLSVVALSPFYTTCSSIGVSVLARNRAAPADFDRVILALVWGFGLFGFAYAAFTGLTLDMLAPALFGRRYSVDLISQCLITVIVFLRVVKGPASVLILVGGGTRSLAGANLVAGAGLVFALLFVQITPTIDAVLLGVLFGDLLSFGAFQRVLLRRARDVSRAILSAIGFELTALAGLVTALALAGQGGVAARAPIALACAGVAALLAMRVLSLAKPVPTRKATPNAATAAACAEAKA